MSYIEQLLDCIDKVPKAKASFQGLDDQARTELAELRRLTPQPVGDHPEVDKRFAENKRLDTEIITLRVLLAWAISKVCDECGCDNVNRTLCPITNPDCPAVRGRKEATG